MNDSYPEITFDDTLKLLSKRYGFASVRSANGKLGTRHYSVLDAANATK
jgi:hypothetical protein